MWLVCAILTALGWGIADIFYKRASVEKEKYSHLKVCIFVGIVMGIHAIITLLVTKVDYNFINEFNCSLPCINSLISKSIFKFFKQ